MRKEIKDKFNMFLFEVRLMFGITFVLLSVGIDIIIVFSNPDMTQTRLFLIYWPYFVGSLFGLLFGAFLLKL